MTSLLQRPNGFWFPGVWAWRWDRMARLDMAAAVLEGGDFEAAKVGGFGCDLFRASDEVDGDGILFWCPGFE